MAAIRLKQRNKTIIHQMKPLVFERVNKHWTLVDEPRKNRKSVILSQDDEADFFDGR